MCLCRQESGSSRIKLAWNWKPFAEEKKPIDLAGIFRFEPSVRVAALGWAGGLILGACQVAQAQVLRYPVGVGATPFALASDYRALGWNPAGLTHAPLNPNRTWIMGSLEGGFSLESSVLERSDLWDDLLDRENASNTWTQMGSAAWLDALSDQQFSAQGELLVAGTSRRSKNGKWGVGYVARQSFVSEAFLGRSTLDLLTAGGAASFLNASYFPMGIRFPIREIGPGVSLPRWWEASMKMEMLGRARFWATPGWGFPGRKAMNWGFPSFGGGKMAGKSTPASGKAALGERILQARRKRRGSGCVRGFFQWL